MLKAFILCIIICLLDVSCSFVSVTVAKNRTPRINIMNQSSRTNMALHCCIQRAFFNISSDGRCRLHRWFYDAESRELTCVCIENASTKASGMLLQGLDGSRAIPSISATNFIENQDLKQGQYAFELKIRTKSDPTKIVQNLFSDVAKSNGAVVITGCYPIPDGSNSYNCSTVYNNKYSVTWEFPENWSGPARFLKNIVYESGKIDFEIVGLHWSRKLPNDSKRLYVDVIMLVEQRSTDVCKKFFEKTTDVILNSTTICRPEFLEEAVLNRPNFVARINLLMQMERDETWAPEMLALSLANRLKWSRYSCRFPVQIRQEMASYVPSEAAAQGEDFEYLVTFIKSALRIPKAKVLSEEEYCNTLVELASEFIRTCHVFKLQEYHGIAEVLVRRTNASFWEVQRQLMLKLNSKDRDNCHFNVEANWVPKGY
ncbi:unnamed protein product [Dicrocoelium dendriticum]|nr:unnamed protein product [Dicrocoelium dendriticum]